MDATESHTGSEPGELILVGSVAGTHGLAGGLRVYPHTDDPDRLLSVSRFYLGDAADSATRYEVTAPPKHQRKKGKLFVLLFLDGVETIDGAASLMGKQVFADSHELPMDDDEVYLDDLVGFAAVSEDGEPIGDVVDVRSMPAHPVFVVETENGRHVLIPALPEFVVEIDSDTTRLVIRVLEGLLD